MVFEFISNMCEHYIKNGGSPSAQLSVALMLIMESPEWQSELRKAFKTDAAKVTHLLEVVSGALAKMEG